MSSTPPPPWTEVTDPDGNTYYWNTETQQTSWEYPSEALDGTVPEEALDEIELTLPVPESQSSAPPLPPKLQTPQYKPATTNMDVPLVSVGAGESAAAGTGAKARPKSYAGDNRIDLTRYKRKINVFGMAIPVWILGILVFSLLTIVVTVSAVLGVSGVASSTSSTSPTPTPFAAPINLKIGAFNMKIFGKTKASDPQVMAVLTKIIQRYDIVLLQEIRDSSQTAIYDLLKDVGGNYGMKLSPRLGRTVSKEQYVYMYKKSVFKVVDDFVFDDVAWGDIYQREPYIVQVRSSLKPTCEFVLIGLHADPDEAPQEVSNMTTVFDAASLHYGQAESPALLLGDFNAGCTYITASEWPEVALRWDSRFVWVIGDSVDTTTGSTDCPYDRLVLSSTLYPKYTTSSAGVFLFDQAYGLTQTETDAVSDHYPVELTLTC